MAVAFTAVSQEPVSTQTAEVAKLSKDLAWKETELRLAANAKNDWQRIANNALSKAEEWKAKATNLEAENNDLREQLDACRLLLAEANIMPSNIRTTTSSNTDTSNTTVLHGANGVYTGGGMTLRQTLPGVWEMKLPNGSMQRIMIPNQ